MGKITYNRGTTYTIGVNYSNANGIAGSKALFTVKQIVDNDPTDALAIFQTDATMTTGSATIALHPNSIADAAAEGQYVYDVKVLDTSGAIYLIDSGQFTLNVTATNRLT